MLCKCISSVQPFWNIIFTSVIVENRSVYVDKQNPVLNQLHFGRVWVNWWRPGVTAHRVLVASCPSSDRDKKKGDSPVLWESDSLDWGPLPCSPPHPTSSRGCIGGLGLLTVKILSKRDSVFRWKVQCGKLYLRAIGLNPLHTNVPCRELVRVVSLLARSDRWTQSQLK